MACFRISAARTSHAGHFQDWHGLTFEGDMYFHLCSTPLQGGAIIQPGNWGRIIRFFGQAHNRWLAESAMEDVRQKEFPDLPSRWSSSFFFDNESEARGYQAAHAAFLILYEVELVDLRAAIHRADYRRNVPNATPSLDWCRAYWRGEHFAAEADGRRCTELLAETPIRVVRVV
jgi:hypothetical protein